MKLSRVVLASNNAGKLRELQALLAPLAVSVIPQAELGIGEADEPHPTFLENALAKARHAARASGLPALADDSGICVDVLGGAPGVRSARYAEDPSGRKSDVANNLKLVAEMSGKAERGAAYHCVLVLVRSADDPVPIVAEGIWRGEVIATPRGTGGFGYDAHFLLPGEGLTAAELEPSRKNALSHRGQAMRGLVQRLREAGLG